MRQSTNVHIVDGTRFMLNTFPVEPGDDKARTPFFAVKIAGDTGFVDLIFRDVGHVEKIVHELQAGTNWLAAATLKPVTVSWTPDPAHGDITSEELAAAVKPVPAPSFVSEDRDGKLHFDDAADKLYREGKCVEGCGRDRSHSPNSKYCRICSVSATPATIPKVDLLPKCCTQLCGNDVRTPHSLFCEACYAQLDKDIPF